MGRCTVTAVGGLGLALALAACSDDLVRPNPTIDHPADPARFTVVTPTAPDFIPDDLYADSSIIEDTEYISGPFLPRELNGRRNPLRPQGFRRPLHLGCGFPVPTAASS